VRLFDSVGVGVKVCGITRAADAESCIDAGVDALGFNFFSGSKRYVDPKTAIEWIRDLEGAVTRVAVLVNASEELLGSVRESGCFEFIQFHGDETPDECARSGGRQWIKALRVRPGDSLDAPGLYGTPHLLLDAWSPTEYGGTGLLTDRAVVSEIIHKFPQKRFALAGGLTPRNVAEAISAVHPAVVDVAGGVESAPGIKDVSLVRAFIDAVRGAQG
jgi:phosphoribosylanthranilate isomerase